MNIKSNDIDNLDFKYVNIYVPLLKFPLFIILPPSLGPGPIGPDLDGRGGPPGPPLIIIGPPRIGGIPRIIPRIGPGGPPRLELKANHYNIQLHFVM